MTGREHDYESPDGVRVRIVPSSDHASGAFVDPGGVDRAFCVPAHRLAEFTRALWEAAGRPVPDLPVIHDPAAVSALAYDIARFFDSQLTHEANAIRLLDAGWRNS